MKNIILLFAFIFAFSVKGQNLTTQYSTITSGTLTCANTQQDLFVIHEAGITLSMTFAFPANPRDGQLVTLVSPGGVTALSLSAAVGTIVNAITGMAAGAPASYMYYLSTNKWYRIK